MEIISRSSVIASAPPERGLALHHKPIGVSPSRPDPALLLTADCTKSGRGLFKGSPAHRIARASVKVISWNVLRLTGAAAEDVAALIQRHRPDLVLLQEATPEIAALPKL